MRTKNWMNKRVFGIRGRLRKMMKCIRSGEQLQVDEIAHSSDSLATRDYSASGYSSKTGEVEAKMDNSNIEEAESSLRESGYLNYEVCFASEFLFFFFCLSSCPFCLFSCMSNSIKQKLTT